MGYGGPNKKGFAKVVLFKNYTCVLNYHENLTFQHLFGVRMQNYFNFQVHAYTVVPDLLTGKSWFFWNNLTLISTKIIIHNKILTVEC